MSEDETQLVAPARRAATRTRPTARCARASSTSSSARSTSASSSRSRSRRRASAASRSTTCCWPARRASARRRSRTSSREELGVGSRSTAGPALERKGDLAAILTDLGERDVLFIDEIHRLNRAVEEILYPAMEDGRLDIIIGQGPARADAALDLPPFTLIGATTRAGLLTKPLRDRFGIIFRLEHYAPDELGASSTARRGSSASRSQARRPRRSPRRSRGTPRIANRLLRRVRDFAQVRGQGAITTEIARRGARPARGRRARARPPRPRAAAHDRREVRRRAGRPLDARRRARRGAGHDRGRLRALPAAAGVPAAHAARPRRDEARTPARRRRSRRRRAVLIAS